MRKFIRAKITSIKITINSSADKKIKFCQVYFFILKTSIIIIIGEKTIKAPVTKEKVSSNSPLRYPIIETAKRPKINHIKYLFICFIWTYI